MSNMQTWWNSSPYNGFNLYIGGSAVCLPLTASRPLLMCPRSARRAGGSSPPGWGRRRLVCRTATARSSATTPRTAYNQGVAEADAAMAVAANLGLAAPDRSGTVIYYDMETYGTTDSCRNAAKSFISGWTHELRAHNNLAGVYGSACYNVTDWSTIRECAGCGLAGALVFESGLHAHCLDVSNSCVSRQPVGQSPAPAAIRRRSSRDLGGSEPGWHRQQRAGWPAHRPRRDWQHSTKHPHRGEATCRRRPSPGCGHLADLEDDRRYLLRCMCGATA